MEPRAPDLSRRAFLGAAALTALAACSDNGNDETTGSTAATEPLPAPTTPATTTPPPTLDGLDERGLQPITASELLAR